MTSFPDFLFLLFSSKNLNKNPNKRDTKPTNAMGIEPKLWDPKSLNFSKNIISIICQNFKKFKKKFSIEDSSKNRVNFVLISQLWGKITKIEVSSKKNSCLIFQAAILIIMD
jgi:hypothetical protein